MITLAVLDMAGTTVRDDGLVERAFLEAVRGSRPPRGTDAALDHVRRTMGRSKIDVFRELFDDDEETAQGANRRFEQAVAAAAADGGVEPLPGAEAAIDALRAGGTRVCLTTGFAAATQEAILDVLGWRSRIDLALAPGDGLRGRPFPDLVLAAVLRLGVDDVREVAVAGDTTSDLLSGWRAGAGIVAGVLTGAHDRATLAEAPHTHLLDSVADLPGVVAAHRATQTSGT